MKFSTFKLSLVCFLCVYFSSGIVLAQEGMKRKVDFDIDQDGMSIKGSLNVSVQFIFFGYPYLKAQYADLVIDELIYDNEVYNANTNRDIISMPFRPEKGGYPIKMSINFVIPVEANNSKGFEIRHMLPAQFFTITDNIYTISDTYSNDKIDQYFKDFNSPKYHDSHFWENSTLGNISPITVQSMTSSIPRQMTMIIDAKLREKKEKEEKEETEAEKEEETDQEKEEDNFWSGEADKKIKEEITEKEKGEDDFWRGNEVKKNVEEKSRKEENKTKPKDFWSGDSKKAKEPDFWSGQGTNEEEIELQKEVAYASGNQYIGEKIVKTRFIKISYRDHGQIDGDRVRIYLNNQVVAENVYLVGSFKFINVELEEGLNKVSIEALNQGDAGKNTAEFKIQDQDDTELYFNRWNLSTGYKGTLLLIKN